MNDVIKKSKSDIFVDLLTEISKQWQRRQFEKQLEKI